MLQKLAKVCKSLQKTLSERLGYRCCNNRLLTESDMAYLIPAVVMTLGVLEGNWSIAIFFK